MGINAAAKEDARALAETLRETKKGLVENEAQKRKILGSLYDVNYRMRKVAQEKSRLTDDLIRTEDNMRDIAKAIHNLEGQIDQQKSRLHSRLRALYKVSGEGYLALLFSQTSAIEVDRALKYLKIVTDNDYNSIRNYQKNIVQLNKQRTKLKEQVQWFLGIQKQIKGQEKQLLKQQQSKNKIVAQLDNTKVNYLQNLQKIRAQSKSLTVNAGDQMLMDLLKPSFFESKGQLPAPAVGNVIQDFGLVHDAATKTRLSHKGWLYATTKGSPALAVFDGRLLYAGSIPGHGYTLVVDHGDHYYTVYCYVRKPRLKIGDPVSKGQVLAEAGTTEDKGDGLYFEIRHFSEPENPAHWLSVGNQKISALSFSREESIR